MKDLQFETLIPFFPTDTVRHTECLQHFIFLFQVSKICKCFTFDPSLGASTYFILFFLELARALYNKLFGNIINNILVGIMGQPFHCSEMTRHPLYSAAWSLAQSLAREPGSQHLAVAQCSTVWLTNIQQTLNNLFSLKHSHTLNISH